MFRVLSNQHYQRRTNQKLRSWENEVFQNREVCGQAFPSFPSPSPVISFLFCSRPNFSRRTRAETLAMQASDGVFVVIFFKVIYNTTIMLDSVSVMSFIIKVSVSVISLSLRLG